MCVRVCACVCVFDAHTRTSACVVEKIIEDRESTTITATREFWSQSSIFLVQCCSLGPKLHQKFRWLQCANLELWIATHCNTLQHTATHCNALQHTATHCNTLQHTATHCITQQHTASHSNTLHHTTTHCNTLQHSATHCNTLQSRASQRNSSVSADVSSEVARHFSHKSHKLYGSFAENDL